MDLNEAQEQALREEAHRTGDFSDWLYFQFVQERFDAIGQMRENEGRCIEGPVSDLCRLAQGELALSETLGRAQDARDPWVHYTLAKACCREGRWVEAERAIEASLRANPRDVSALNLVIRCAARAGDQSRRDCLIARSLAIAPEQPDIEEMARTAPVEEPFLGLVPSPGPIEFYVPAFNVERYMADAITGLLHQSHPLHGILVIDDGSRDHSIAIAERYPVRILRHEENKGLAAARNTAFQHASAPYLGAVDTDARPEPGLAKYMLMEFENTSARLAGVSGRLIELHKTTPADRWRLLRMSQDRGPVRVYMPKFLVGSNTVFRRAPVLEAGGYDERYRTNSEDVHICRNLHKAGYCFCFTPHAVAHHTRTDTMQSVMGTAWNWRYWLKMENNTFEDPARLVGMMYNALNEAVEHINTFIEADELDVIYIEIAYIFYDIFRDLAVCIERGAHSRAVAVHVQRRMLQAADELDARFGGRLGAKIRRDTAEWMTDGGADWPEMDEAFERDLAGFFYEMNRFFQSLPRDMYKFISKPGL